MARPWSLAELDQRSRELRLLALSALEGGERGHVGSTMSLVEILRVLYDEVLRIDPGDPMAEDRDRFILSKGHGCIALYAMLADKGFFPHADLRDFCRYGSGLGGHPERGHVPGVEASTGSLGHGLAIGVGIAYATSRLRHSDARVFVVLGDGELDEGSVWESALAASHHRLANLTVIVDHNHLQSYGPVVEVWDLEPLAAKWRAFGFDTVEVDGHDLAELRRGLGSRGDADRPRAVIAHTVKGRGISFAESDPSWHHKAKITSVDADTMREAILGA